MFGNFLAVGDAVVNVQADGVLDVLHRLFVGVALAIATLKHGAGNEAAVRISLNGDG